MRKLVMTETTTDHAATPSQDSGGPIVGDEHSMISASVRALHEQRQREREWEQGGGTDDNPFAEQAPTITERKWDGPDGPVKLQDAQRASSAAHKAEFG